MVIQLSGCRRNLRPESYPSGQEEASDSAHRSAHCIRPGNQHCQGKYAEGGTSCDGHQGHADAQDATHFLQQKHLTEYQCAHDHDGGFNDNRGCSFARLHLETATDYVLQDDQGGGV